MERGSGLCLFYVRKRASDEEKILAVEGVVHGLVDWLRDQRMNH